MEWKFVDGIPIYSQIVNELTVRIARHDSGEKLPSVRDTAADACVNRTCRELAELEQKRAGCAPRKGRTEDLWRRMKALKEIYKGGYQVRYVDELVEKLRNIGMSDMEIIEAIYRLRGKEK